MYKARQLTKRKCATTALLAVLTTVLLTSCKRPEPEDTRPCSETIKITQRNGVDVVQTVSGLYLRASIARGWYCGSTPETRHLVDGGSATFYWQDGVLNSYGPKPKPVPLSAKAVSINLPVISLGDAKSRERNKETIGYQAWWHTPAIPHKLYPLDLLPNWAVPGSPDPQAGVGTIKRSPPRWAVRGTVNPDDGQPFVTQCSMNPPPEWDGKDHRPEATKELDPVWLIQAATSKSQNFNTCRGGVSAANGTYISAMIDVPGAAVPEIDKIYQQVSQWLAQIIVE